MTTAAARLVDLSGLSGVSAGTHLLAIAAAGATAAARLVAYSGLLTGTAAQHLLTDRAPATAATSGGSAVAFKPRRFPHEDDEALLLCGVI